MKAFIVLLCLFLLAGAVYFVPSLHQKAVQLLTYNACDTPLPYKIGAVDSRFGLSSQEVLNDTQKATSIWSTVEGKNLFIYSPNAELTVNFVYDQRQALDSSINQLHSNLSEQNKSLSEQIDAYKQDQADFNQKVVAFKSLIKSYQDKGGVTQQEYTDLQNQQNSLNTEATKLNNEAQQLNIATDSYNSGVSVLNSDINQFQNVLAQKPEEGLYDGNNDTISIYYADNQDELIHTLTHEFGHSLGMEHVQDKNAIMYPYTTNLITPTPDDIKELSYVCRNQSVIIHNLQEFDIWVYTERQKYFHS